MRLPGPLPRPVLPMILLLLALGPGLRAQTPAPAAPEATPSERPTPEESPTPEEAPTAIPTPTPPPTVSMVYTGGSRGVGSGLYIQENSAQLAELAALGAVEIPELAAFHGTLAQGPFLLRAEDRTMAQVLRFLQAGDVRCEKTVAVQGVATPFDMLVLETPGAPAFLGDLIGAPQAYGQRRCTAGDLTAFLTFPEGTYGLPQWTLEAFEVRQALAGVVREEEALWPFTLTGRPIQERARVFALLKVLQAKVPGRIYVDAGSFVDGASTAVDGAPSLHRPLGFDMLEALKPAALAPGETELALGAYAFFEDIHGRGLPYVATNWRAKDSDLAFPAYRIVEVETPAGPKSLAFLGILDPGLLDTLPRLKAEGVEITDPIEAIAAALRAIAAEGLYPDAIVALSTASGGVLEEIRRRARGVDVLIGDPTFATLRVAQMDAHLRPLPRELKGAPLTLSMDGVALVDLTFGGDDGALLEIDQRPKPVVAELPLDPWVRGRVTAVRARVYPDMEAPLVAPPGARIARTLTHGEWAQLVCESLRRQSRADVVLLKDLPPPPKSPGVLTEMGVADALVGLDAVELHRVQGSELPWVLDRAYGQVSVSCGAALGTSPTIQGRSVEDDRMYWVVTTEATRKTSALSGILATAHSTKVLDQPAFAPLEGANGGALSLQGATLRALGDILGEVSDPALVLPRLLEQGTVGHPPQWVLRARTVALEVEGFQGMETDVFEEVPETLANSPSSLTVGAKGDVALEYDSMGIYGDLRGRVRYQSIRVAGGETQEIADDWRLALSVSLPKLHFPHGAAFAAMPFAQLLYDSEFTPFEEDDGTFLPIQSDLSGTIGLSARRWKYLRSLKLGVFANRAMAQLETKPTELGTSLTAETRHSLGGSATLRSIWDTQLFKKTQDDDPSDLRFRASGELRLTLPLSTFLGASLYAQGLAIYGRVPETSELGTAYTVGVALDAYGAVNLARVRGPGFR